jgi:predicted RNase H-like nuclease (RuvC/YqgF family)
MSLIKMLDMELETQSLKTESTPTAFESALQQIESDAHQISALTKECKRLEINILHASIKHENEMRLKDRENAELTLKLTHAYSKISALITAAENGTINYSQLEDARKLVFLHQGK